MDIVLIILGSLLLLIGIIGCLIPGLPGPPISYGGLVLLLFHSGAKAELTAGLMIAYAIAVVIVFLLDYYMPIWGTKKFGGTNAGKYGSIIGLIAGIFILPTFMGPVGIIVGPFAGAVIGEMITGQEFRRALKSGVGSFLGFAAGTAIKLVLSFAITYQFVKVLL